MSSARSAFKSARRGWYVRFSLRTLLLAIAAVSIWLGVQVNRARYQRLAVEELRNLGCDIFYDNARRPWGYTWIPAYENNRDQVMRDRLWFDKYFSEDLAHNVIEVFFPEHANDDDLAILKNLPYLTTVELSDSKITNAGLQQLEGLAQLRVLRLDNTTIDDDGFIHLSKLSSIIGLNLSGTRIGDRGVEIICGLQSLRHLELKGTQLTDRGAKHLAKLKNLDGFLDLSHTKLTDASIPILRQLTKLTVLRLYATNLSTQGIEELRLALPTTGVRP